MEASAEARSLLWAAAFVRGFPARGDAPERPRRDELKPGAAPASATDILALLGTSSVSETASAPSSKPDEARQRLAAEHVRGASADTLSELTAALIQLLPRKADNFHAVKFAAAVIPKAARVSAPLAAAVMSSLMFYCTGPDLADLARWEATVAAIGELSA